MPSFGSRSGDAANVLAWADAITSWESHARRLRDAGHPDHAREAQAHADRARANRSEAIESGIKRWGADAFRAEVDLQVKLSRLPQPPLVTGVVDQTAPERVGGPAWRDAAHPDGVSQRSSADTRAVLKGEWY